MRKFIQASVVLCALALPISVAPSTSEDVAWVRVSTLCAQAEACEPEPDYICSKKDEDKLEHNCSKGCDSREY